MDLPELRRRAAEYGRKLEQVKAETEPPAWGWYPFPTVPAFIDIFDALLTGDNRSLIENAAELRMADIGGADGDLAFFLDSVGFQVDLFEGGPAWVSRLRMLPPRRLKDALGSKVEIYEIDLDHDFSLPHDYHLVFFLGVLYHLRNPLLALEQLARSAEYCILSTKVARYIPARRFGRRSRHDVADVPIAYLLDAFEVDTTVASNHWVFSEAGLRRALSRSGWAIREYCVTGDRDAEVTSQVESRAWCLLQSELHGRPEQDALRLAIERRDGDETFQAFKRLLD